MKSKSIFISHAVVNKKLADKLVDLLETGIGISDSEIFCSSLEGLGIPSGTNFVDFIKKQISNPKVVIMLITQEYFDSAFCLCELGASWVLSHKIIPLIVQPLDYSDVKAVLSGIQVLKIDQKSDLNEMQSELTSALSIEGKTFARWEVKRDKFLKELAGYFKSYKPKINITEDAFKKIELQYKEAVKEIETIEEELDQKNILIEQLKKVKDSESVKKVIYDSLESKDQFFELVKIAKRALKPLPSIVCEALYYHFRNERLPWPGFGGDSERDEIKNAIEQDFLEGYEDGADVIEDDPKVSDAIVALTDLQRFIWGVDEKDEFEDDNKDEFEEYYIDSYGHRPKFSSRRFWSKHLL